jgi:hypothetical protein
MDKELFDRDLQRQAEKRSYERIRQKIAEDIRQVMADNSITFGQMAAKLKWPVRETRTRINSADLRLSQLVAILNVFGLDFYPVMRPRKPWIGN